MSDLDDEDYFVPLTDQRVFGAGIKRKRIAFVPASNDERSVSAPPVSATQSAGDRYLSIVLGKDVSQSSASLPQTPVSDSTDVTEQAMVCTVCKQPVTTTGTDKTTAELHETSIAHQVCMQHSHPPSHLDRDRIGLKYLSGYGWDPDARRGLGAREEGIRMPIKAKEKRDTAGLGVNKSENDCDDLVKEKATAKKSEGKVVKLNFKEVRKIEAEKRKKAERLRRAFYGENLSHYLGSDS